MIRLLKVVGKHQASQQLLVNVLFANYADRLISNFSRKNT